MFTAQSVKPITIPPKREYRRAEFVSRRKELNAVDQRVAQGKRGEDMDYPVLNLWGIEGSGKSWLMRHLARLYRGSGRLRKGECKRTFTVLFNLKGFEPFEWTAPNLASLLRPAVGNILGQVKEQVKDVAQEQEVAENLLACVEAAATDQEKPKVLAQSFVDWIISLTDQFVPLILLDTIEKATSKALSQIELHLLEPLASTDQVILITAGRREVARWRRFAVRRRQEEPIELTAFTRQDTIRQIKKQGFEWPGELVYPYSFGLPYVSQALATAISELSNGHRVDEKFIGENKDYFGKWLEALADHLLRTAPVDLQSTLRVLCVLRTIPQGALPYLLPSEPEDYRTLLDDLESTRLVWWDPKQGVYLMAPSLRRLLDLSLRLEQPGVFEQRHGQASEYYRQAISTNPYDCGASLVEALYHTAYGYPDQPSEKVRVLLDQTLKPDNFTVGGADFLLERLREDDELHEALSDSLTAHVLQSVQELCRSVRRTRLSTS